MPANVPRERWRHERGPLVGPPLPRTDPTYTGHLQRRYLDEIGSFPTPNLHLVEVFVAFTAQFHGVLRADLLDVAGYDGQSCAVVVGQLGIRALAAVSHPTQCRHRSNVIVPPFAAPRRNGRVVHGTSHGEIPDDIPIQLRQVFAQSSPFPLGLRLVVDVVQ